MDARGKELKHSRLLIDGADYGAAPAVLWIRSGRHSFELVSGDRKATLEQVVPRGYYRLRMMLEPQTPAAGTTPADAPKFLLASLEPAVIDARIKANLGPIKFCYDTALPKNPKLKGKLIVFFIIESDGRVDVAFIRSSTMVHEGVEQCVAERFRGIRFPAPEGEGIVTVNYPISFDTR